MAARCAASIKGGGLFVEETSPFGTPRDNEGLPPLDPRTAHIKSAFSNRMRVHRRGAAALFAAFDLICSLRPLPLCGGVIRRNLSYFKDRF